MSKNNTLVLASNSPRRKQLLSLGGWMFNVIVADVDESLRPGEAPGNYVMRLAKAKAHKIADTTARPENIIIAADTAVVDEGDIIGKPLDEQDAANVLKRLRGHTHQVYTGLAVHRVSDAYSLTDLTVTDVPMRNYSDDEVDAYVHTGDPFDKAGAYAIQHPDFHPVEHLTGCFASVMGLPLCRLTSLLHILDISPKSSIDISCQTELGYDCPVSNAILRGEFVKN